MHARVSEFDWASTPVGARATWPQSLRATIKTLLGSRYPMILLWGPELVQIYNEAYIRLIGDKHPSALGRSIRETQAESWDIIGPMIHEVMSSGVPNWVPAQRLPLERSGYREESYFSLSYSAVEDDAGRITGMLCVCSEVTEQVLGERRLRLLRDLAVKASETHSVEESCQHISSVIAEHPLDVPFAALYLTEADGRSLALVRSAGLSAAARASLCPDRIDLHRDLPPEGSATQGGASQTVGDRPARHTQPQPTDAPSRSRSDLLRALRSALEGGSVALVALDGAPVGGPWLTPVTEALALPLGGSGQASMFGVILAGKSPNRAFDEGYRSFYELLAGQVSSAIKNGRAHQDERRRTEALAELDRAKTAFFSNISHELRTPLTLILGPVEHALAQGSKSLGGADLEAVQRSALRLLRLVNDLLDFSRVEAGGLQTRFEATDLATLTLDLASSFRSLIERAGLKLVVDCKPLPAQVYVDREHWEKIVLNLLSNAFKFTLEGQIEVSLAARGARVELVVRDTGTGIAPGELPRIFERFHRVQGADGRSFEGTGIGLSLVAELVRHHGGEVSVASVEGRGSRFSVSIPWGSPEQSSEALEQERPLAPRAESAYVLSAEQWLDKPDGRSPRGSHEAAPARARVPVKEAGRVLVADDNADMREYLVRLLGEHWEVESAGDGVAALARAREHRPDLVISDVMMPRLDGYGLLRELRADPQTRAVPVILLSARAGEEALIEGLETGADDYLIKPFSARELLTRVRSELTTARLRRALAEAEERARGQSMLRFLADASATLAESLDYPTTLAQVARLAVPILADWCFIDLVEDNGAIARVEVAHADARHAELGLAIKAFPAAASDNRQNPPTQALLEGRSILVEDVSDERMRTMSHNEQHLALMRRIGVHSFMSVPLRARGRILGSISLGVSDSERRYGKADLTVAEDLARRCALAVDNAGLYKEAQRAIVARDQFLSIASHELRTPLTPLQLQIHTLQGKVAEVARDEQAAEWLRRKFAVLRRQSERLDRLVTELLDVTRISAAQLSLRPEWIQLEQVTREVLARFEETGELARSGCEVELRAEPGISGHWDRLRVDQLLTNLLENALKFGRGKPVQIALESRGSFARLTLTDHGIGIAEADHSRVFERFERAVPEQHYGGLGLGLWIVRSILEAMGGRVEVHSLPGQGATFIAELPYSRPGVEPPAPDREQPHHSSQR
jgi:signal transduction histidine kinase/DNA-binding NarL/FixJ family response regulator